MGANVLRGPDQIPWDGKLNYDYQLWIDSDIVFSTEKFWQLADLGTSQADAVDENGETVEGKDHPISAGYIQLKMDEPLQYTGWKKTTSVTMVV